MNSSARIVLCAACRAPGSDVIFCGPRHFDHVMRGQINTAYPNEWPAHMEQGFIDQWGIWMTREEAMKVAKESGQPLDMERNGNPATQLFSEGLY